MRMIMEVTLPNEPFNAAIRDGSVEKKIQQILGDIKPEAAYFSEQDGKRGAIFIVDVPDPSAVPRLAEPFFLTFNASVQFRIVMLPEDLAKSGLAELGKKYG
jgi:hypothetical protein